MIKRRMQANATDQLGGDCLALGGEVCVLCLQLLHTRVKFLRHVARGGLEFVSFGSHFSRFLAELVKRQCSLLQLLPCSRQGFR